MDSAYLGSQPRLNLQYFQLDKLLVYHLGSFFMESVRKDIVNTQMLFLSRITQTPSESTKSFWVILKGNFFLRRCVPKGLWVKVISSYNHYNPDPHSLQLEKSILVLGIMPTKIVAVS